MCRLLLTPNCSKLNILCRNSPKRHLTATSCKSFGKCQNTGTFVKTGARYKSGLRGLLDNRQTFHLDKLGFCTTNVRENKGSERGKANSPMEIANILRKEMYNEKSHGRPYDVRNVSKLVTSFPYLPTYDWNKNWLLQYYPSFYLKMVDQHFSSKEFLHGADLAVEYLLEGAGNGNFTEIIDALEPQLLEEMLANRKYVSDELKSMLNKDVLFELTFRNEHSLCDYEITELNTPGMARVSLTSVLRGYAMISTEMSQSLSKTIRPGGAGKLNNNPLDMNIHVLIRCYRDYSYGYPDRDWTIDGFTFIMDIPELFSVYIL